MKFKSEVQLEALNNATVDTDKFLVSDSSAVKYRTGAQVLSDIGGQSALTNPVTGTGTLNFVSKFTSTGSTLGNSQIFDNGTDVGIGTSGPLNKVDIVSSNNDSFGAITVRPLNQTQTMSLGWQGVSASLNFIVNTAASERMRITNVGNTGINTSIPETRLQIEDITKVLTNNVAGVAQGTLSLVSTDAQAANIGASLVFGGNYINSNSTRIAYAAITGRKSNSSSVNADGYLSFLTWRSTGLTEAMRINPAGNVGIGTNNPTVIGGNITTLDIRGTNGGGIRSGVSGGSESTFYTIAAGCYLGTISNIPLYFQTNNSVKATILANGNVGIGTTSPGAKLTLSTPNPYDGTILQLQSRDEPTAYNLKINEVLSAGVVQWSFDMTNGGSAYNNVLVFDRGNVGIGTTSPAAKLDIQASGTAQTSILGRGSDGDFRLTTRQDVSTNTYGSVIGEIGVDYITTRNTAVRFHRGGSTTGGFITFTTNNGNEKMRIDPDGNVGIGTTSPVAKLDIGGASGEMIRLADSSTIGNPFITFFQTSTRRAYIQYVDSGDNLTLASEYGGIVLATGTNGNEAEKMRITSSGNVGIGATSPVRALQVGNFSGNPEICIGSGTTGIGGLTFGDGAGGNDPWRGFIQYNHATDAMLIGTSNAGWLTLTNGGALGLNVNPTNTAGRFEASNDIVAYSSSDKRWKTNIKNIDSPLEKISQINGVEFDWIEDEPVHGNKGHDIGVIAQEIENILPDAVQTRESGMKAVKYEKVIPLLIEAIKEQQKQIEELKQLLNGFTK